MYKPIELYVKDIIVISIMSDRREIIEKINTLLDTGQHIGIDVATYIYANYPKLVKEKATGLTINISKMTDEMLKKILGIAERSSTDEIPFYLTLGKNP